MHPYSPSADQSSPEVVSDAPTGVTPPPPVTVPSGASAPDPFSVKLQVGISEAHWRPVALPSVRPLVIPPPGGVPPGPSRRSAP